LDTQIHNLIAEYRKRLEGCGIQAQRIILFGSHAAGTATPQSDIDLVVISNDFQGMDYFDRLRLLGRARVGLKRPMEILGYTEREFRSHKKGSFISEEVKAKGIEFMA